MPLLENRQHLERRSESVKRARVEQPYPSLNEVYQRFVESSGDVPNRTFQQMKSYSKKRLSAEMVDSERLLELGKERIGFFYLWAHINDIENRENLIKWVKAFVDASIATLSPRWSFSEARCGLSIVQFAVDQLLEAREPSCSEEVKQALVELGQLISGGISGWQQRFGTPPANQASSSGSDAVILLS